MEYNPLTRRYWLSDDTSVNYLFACRKPAGMTRRPRTSAVLFDLDGTLVDSAPDLAGAANAMRAARGLRAAAATTRCGRMVGSGARGMVGVGVRRRARRRRLTTACATSFSQRYEHACCARRASSTA